MPSFSFSAAVNSSSVQGLSYTEEGKVLAVTYNSGPSYIYTGVPKHKAVECLGAESVGNYIATQIKGHFPYLKVGLQDQALVKTPAPTETATETAQAPVAQVVRHPRRRRSS